MVEESLIKKLMASMKCGVCGQRYEADNISVLAHQDDLWFIGALCSACNTQCLVAAIVKEDKVTEVITDLTEAELDKFVGVDMVRANDVLDMHDFLKNFDGGFSRLFGQE